MVPSDPEPLARRYYELFNARQFDAAERLISPMAVFRYPHSRELVIGRAGYRELVRLWVQAFPDAVADIWRLAERADGIIEVDLVGRGTHQGPLSFGGPLTLPPTGKIAELLIRDTLEIRDGQIVASTFQFDVKEMLRRLGAAIQNL